MQDNTMPTQLEQAEALVKTILQTAICSSEFPSLINKLLSLTSTINETADGSISSLSLTYRRLIDFYRSMSGAYSSARFIDNTLLREPIMREPF